MFVVRFWMVLTIVLFMKVVHTGATEQVLHLNPARLTFLWVIKIAYIRLVQLPIRRETFEKPRLCWFALSVGLQLIICGAESSVDVTSLMM
jgi:hypothetical protein